MNPQSIFFNALLIVPLVLAGFYLMYYASQKTEDEVLDLSKKIGWWTALGFGLPLALLFVVGFSFSVYDFLKSNPLVINPTYIENCRIAELCHNMKRARDDCSVSGNYDLCLSIKLDNNYDDSMRNCTSSGQPIAPNADTPNQFTCYFIKAARSLF